MPVGNGAKEKPHYAGHRERLRQRFLKAPDALPDYEILELILFRSIPRKDVKPLAKELLKEFGSLSGALSAAPVRLRDFKVPEAAIVDFRIVREAGIR
ncbi:MAG: hypothetical protein JJ865_08850, partial [Parvibaculum sp.]|nr:hypothetical protein [Parvibaculum sp.]